LAKVEEQETENDNCLVPHDPIEWKLKYCMEKEGTEDVESVMNGNCAQEASPSNDPVCAQNEYWEKHWCELNKKTQDTQIIQDCIFDKGIFPAGAEETAD
jgi:hypothetical protein